MQKSDEATLKRLQKVRTKDDCKRAQDELAISPEAMFVTNGRQRPFTYIKGLTPCIPKELTSSYPSGHAAISKMLALVLGDLFPDRKDALLKRSQQIADDRVVGGVHHPSDIRAGQKLADNLYPLLNNSSNYREALRSAKEKLNGN